MSIYNESGFRFDFSAAPGSVIHDKTGELHDGNTIWPGVDFRVLEVSREIWIEVKSWSYKLILEKSERLKAKRDFTLKTGADEFRNEIVTKFLGTTAYLYWSRNQVPDQVYYIVFLEPPNRGSRPLLMSFRDRLRDEFKKAQARPWGKRIQYAVVDRAEFQARFPNYPVSHI